MNSLKKIYHLSTCDTNKAILAEVNPTKDIELIDIKEQNIKAKELDFAAKQLGSYEALFSKKAMKYRSMGLNKVELSEKDIRKLILEEYTFLKRPVSIINGKVTAGITKDAIEQLKNNIHHKTK
jgi:arsenate reductase